MLLTEEKLYTGETSVNITKCLREINHFVESIHNSHSAWKLI